MPRKENVSFRVEPKLLEKLDDAIKKRYFYNRSHALEVALTILLENLTVVKGPIIGVDEEMLRAMLQAAADKSGKEVKEQQ